jgi:hypothetical protein
MRFFFDYTSSDQSLYDYHGHEFLNPEAAMEFAQAIAEDLRQSLTDDWNSWSVQVRSPQGKSIFSLTVGTAPIAA